MESASSPSQIVSLSTLQNLGVKPQEKKPPHRFTAKFKEIQVQVPSSRHPERMKVKKMYVLQSQLTNVAKKVLGTIGKTEDEVASLHLPSQPAQAQILILLSEIEQKIAEGINTRFSGMVEVLTTTPDRKKHAGYVEMRAGGQTYYISKSGLEAVLRCPKGTVDTYLRDGTIRQLLVGATNEAQQLDRIKAIYAQRDELSAKGNALTLSPDVWRRLGAKKTLSASDNPSDFLKMYKRDGVGPTEVYVRQTEVQGYLGHLSNTHHMRLISGYKRDLVYQEALQDAYNKKKLESIDELSSDTEHADTLVDSSTSSIVSMSIASSSSGPTTGRMTEIPAYMVEELPFGSASPSDSTYVISINVVTGHADDRTPIVERRTAGIDAVAGALHLSEPVVRAVRDFRGGEELVLRTRMMGELSGLSREQALIADIIWDNLQTITDEEIRVYSHVLGTPIALDRENEVLKFGTEMLGSGTSGVVVKASYEALGWHESIEGRGRQAGVAAWKRPTPLAQQHGGLADEAKAAHDLRDIPFVSGFLMARGGIVATRVGEEGPISRENLNKLQLAPAARWRIFSQALQGLHGIHQRGYVHRDVKSDNIVLIKTARGSIEPLIIDLGLAQKMTDPWVGGGTPNYDPPEYIAGKAKAYDPSKDAFGMGVIAARDFLGIPPPWFHGGLSGVSMEKGLKKLRQQVLAREDVPLEIRQGILILLESKSSKRSIPEAFNLIQQGIAKLEA